MTKEELIEEGYRLGIVRRSLAKAFIELVMKAEREACAKVCDELAELNRFSETDSMWEWGECAAAIRARGNV